VTTNEGKYREVAKGLGKVGIDCEMLDMDYPEVQCDSLEEVVTSSMKWLSGKMEGDFLIDDSGLFISSLGGFPGVYSSYVYRTIGPEGLLKILQGVKNRAAEFRCCFGLNWKGEDRLFVDVAEGSITQEKRGEGGFGFDPIFIPTGESATFAEMPIEEKNKLSHRGKALQKVLEFLGKQ
jgi:XTP/dITP diphosphohydrolase